MLSIGSRVISRSKAIHKVDWEETVAEGGGRLLGLIRTEGEGEAPDR